ncbi:MAG: DUF3108 domain-containing protein [Alphaproteobacteria bacterium]|nr:DUF3108 domain-containing protein [Alphaproteobacteria bacterium]
MTKKNLLIVCLVWYFSCFNVYGIELKQNFGIKVGVFDAGSVEVKYNSKNGAYVIETKVVTKNFFGKVYPFFAKYEAEGLEVSNGVKPVSYKTETVGRNHKRTKRIFYDKNGRGVKRIATKDGKISQRDIKDMPETADLSDLQSVFAEMIKNILKTGSCSLEREVYDDKKYYKVFIRDEGAENRWFEFLKKNENAYKCSVYIHNLKQNNDNILWDLSADRPINMWFVVDAKREVLEIYEIKIDKTMVGDIVVYKN